MCNVIILYGYSFSRNMAHVSKQQVTGEFLTSWRWVSYSYNWSFYFLLDFCATIFFDDKKAYVPLKMFCRLTRGLAITELLLSKYMYKYAQQHNIQTKDTTISGIHHTRQSRILPKLILPCSTLQLCSADNKIMIRNFEFCIYQKCRMIT